MQHTRSPSNTSSMMPFAGGSLYLPQASFTATNADNIKTYDALNPTTRNPTAMAPLRTYFNGDPVAYDSYDSYNSKAGFSADGSAYSAISTAPSQWSYTTDWEGPTDTQHCESDPNQDQSYKSDPNDVQSASSATGRRRSVEKADPSSARAVYLEKNRQAASKCRTKQKRQQEDLVEIAREKERTNKVLKAEVEFLTSDLHDLIELVGKHDTCVDSRLRRYIQVEADRLLARDGHSPVAELLLSNSSSSRGSASPENSEGRFTHLRFNTYVGDSYLKK